MSINPTDSATHEAQVLHEIQNFKVTDQWGAREERKRLQDLFATAQLAAGQFTDDKGMRPDPRVFQHFRQRTVASAEMIYPHRRIDEHGITRLREHAAVVSISGVSACHPAPPAGAHSHSR